MKVDLLIAKNRYNSTASFALSLASSLRKKNVDTRLFYIDEEYFFEAFYTITSDPPDFTCSFSDIRLGNRPLADLLQIPHLSLLIDPAIYFLHHLKSPFSHVSCVDQEDVDFINSLGFKNAFFFPHAADIALQTPVEKERPFETVFFGTCIDYEKVADSWKEKYSKKQQAILHEAALSVLTSETSVLKALIALGVTEEDLPLFHFEVDTYTRGKDRVSLLKNHNAHIWGSGPWKKYCPKASVHAPISFEETLEIMKKAKIVFNSSPRFKKGSHERIFYALMCGAAPVTAENGFTKKVFKKEEIITYAYGDYHLSQSFSSRRHIAEKGQQRVLKEHTWDKRCEILLAYF